MKDNRVLDPLQDMFFTTVDELYENIDYIKNRFSELDLDLQQIYKWYFFFQLCLLKDLRMNPIKSNLWGYIVGIVSYQEVKLSYYQFKKRRN